MTGDFYVTRHSNLAEVHVIFHLVTDESVSTTAADISSRHPVILAYRNILKTCFRHDVRHVTLPLLLVHEMSEVSKYYLCVLSYVLKPLSHVNFHWYLFKILRYCFNCRTGNL